MKSFVLALLFLFGLSFWSHLLVTHYSEVSVNSLSIKFNQSSRNFVICKCHCCSLNVSSCQLFHHHIWALKENVTCHSCTIEFCRHNQTDQMKCHLSSILKTECYRLMRYNDASTFVSVRPFLQ